MKDIKRERSKLKQVRHIERIVDKINKIEGSLAKLRAELLILLGEY